jgi:hypothetical protein
MIKLRDGSYHLLDTPRFCASHPPKARLVVRAVAYGFFVREKRYPRWGAAGVQREDAEADNVVIGADMYVLKGNQPRFYSHAPV